MDSETSTPSTSTNDCSGGIGELWFVSKSLLSNGIERKSADRSFIATGMVKGVSEDFLTFSTSLESSEFPSLLRGGVQVQKSGPGTPSAEDSDRDTKMLLLSVPAA
jgi:hypothetical protein